MGLKYQPREIQPTLYFVLGPPDVIPLPVDQGLSSVVECWPLDVIPLPVDQGLSSVVECLSLRPEVQGSTTSPGRFSLHFTLC